jgi:5-hydroxyisourate hydrolase-like protein (transthyretin family)
VSAEADGYAPWETSVALTRPMRLDLRLQPAARLRGQVVERASGRPVPDAEVKLAPAATSGPGRAASTHTAEDGSFAFETVAAGRYQLSARSGRLLAIGPAVDLIATQTVERVRLAMDPGIAVSGRLRDAAGRGVPGIELTLGDARATSGADGHFRLDGVLPGQQSLSGAPSAAGWRGFWRTLTVPLEGLADVEVVLARGALLTGRVLTAEGLPAEGVVVSAEQKRWSVGMAESAADGSFRIAGLDGAAVSVRGWHPALGIARQELAAWGGQSSRAVELRLTAGASIAGRVAFEDGSPAAAVSVAFSGQELGTAYNSVSTGDDGSYRVRGLPPGRYTVHARRKGAPSWLSRSTETPDFRILTLGENEQRAGVDMVLARGGQSLAGTVSLADGKPAPGTQVVAGRERGAGHPLKPESYQVEHSAVVGPEGRFRIDDVEPGAFTLWAVRPGFPDAQVEHVPAGTADVRLRLTAPASLTGLVTRADGSPCPLFVLSLVSTQARRSSLGSRTVSDPGGAFDWTGLEAGTYQVRVSSLDVGASQLVTLAPGERKQGLHLVLDRSTEVTGTVIDGQSGAPLAGVSVAAVLPGQRLSTATRTDGSFQLGGILPGEDGRLTVSPPTGLAAQMRSFTLAAGTSRLDLGVFRLVKPDAAQRPGTSASMRSRSP